MPLVRDSRLAVHPAVGPRADIVPHRLAPPAERAHGGQLLLEAGQLGEEHAMPDLGQQGAEQRLVADPLRLGLEGDLELVRRLAHRLDERDRVLGRHHLGRGGERRQLRVQRGDAAEPEPDDRDVVQVGENHPEGGAHLALRRHLVARVARTRLGQRPPRGAAPLSVDLLVGAHPLAVGGDVPVRLANGAALQPLALVRVHHLEQGDDRPQRLWLQEERAVDCGGQPPLHSRQRVEQPRGRVLE
mmetsp:Transcript_27910/g.92793  ORF Transcript_27910/g.92793 Transcript_27910/m.92793 type:complete len:244 (+) Transcript_27910:143-874(+)